MNGEIAHVCSGCGLWFYDAAVRVQPPTDDDWYGDPALTAPPNLEACLRSMKPAFDRQIGFLEDIALDHSLLDMGCGLGLFLAAADARGWRVAGVEKNPDAISAAAAAFGLVLHTNVDELARESFGVVRYSHVLEHVADPVAFVSDGVSRLAPGGVAVALVPNARPLCYTAVNWLRRLTGRRGRVVAPMQPGHHILGYTQSSLSALFAQAGLTPLRVFDISMGSRTYYPLFYDGLTTRQRLTDFPLKMLIRYWLPILADNLGNPVGRGQWIIGYFRKPA